MNHRPARRRWSCRSTRFGEGFPTTSRWSVRRNDAFLAAEPVIASYLRNVYLGGGPAAARVFEALNAFRREQMEQMIAAGLARTMPDPEVGMMLYGILGLSSLILRPLLERSDELDENDPATRARSRAA